MAIVSNAGSTFGPRDGFGGFQLGEDINKLLYQLQGGPGKGNGVGLNLTNMTEAIDKTGKSTTVGTQTTQEQIREVQERQWQEQIQEVMNEVVTRGDPASMQSLQELIRTLVGGGTEEQKAQQEARKAEIERARGGAADYSKASAQMDSAQAAQAASRQAMEQSLSNINKAIQGAGSSGGSMQALLAQNASRAAAELQAKTTLDATTAYGGIASQYQGILEALTRPNNSQTETLLQALQLAMTANQSTQRNTTTNRTGLERTEKNTDRIQNVTTNSVTDTIENTLRNVLQQGLQIGGNGGGGGGGRLSSGGGKSAPSQPLVGSWEKEYTPTSVYGADLYPKEAPAGPAPNWSTYAPNDTKIFFDPATKTYHDGTGAA